VWERVPNPSLTARLDSCQSVVPIDPRSKSLKALATPYNRAHHRFAVFTACATFVLIVAGALVTSNDAGLSIPDWPTSFGSFSVPPLRGGIRYEWSHRAIAGSIVLLTISIAAWAWLTDRRRWMKWLGVGALCTVITQAILGGLTVLLLQPPWVSSAHAAVAQTFFCIAVLIAIFTGRKWVEEVPHVEFDISRPSLRALTLLSIFVLYVQLILGAMFRHHGMSWWPHVLNSSVVAFVLTWTAIRALSQFSKIEAVRRPAVIVLSLVIAQLCLGFVAFMTRIAWGRDAVQPELPMVISTVAHVALGALLLASTVVLAVQVWRHVAMPLARPVTRRERPMAA
jgi:heme a synthase